MAAEAAMAVVVVAVAAMAVAPMVAMVMVAMVMVALPAAAVANVERRGWGGRWKCLNSCWRWRRWRS